MHQLLAQVSRTTSNCSVSARRFTTAAAVTLLCAFTSKSAAQGGLQVQWAYAPITTGGSTAYSPDGSLVAIGGTGGIQIFSSASRKLQRCIPSGYSAGGLAFLPGSKTLAAVDSSVIQFWDVDTGVLTGTLQASGAYVTSLAISHDGSMAAACESDGSNIYQLPKATIETWNISTENLLTSTSMSLTLLDGIAFSPDGSSIAVCGFSGGPVLQILSSSTLDPISTINTTANSVFAVAFSPDGNTLADSGVTWDSVTQTQNSVVEMWNLSTSKQIASLNSTLNSIYAVGFSPNGTILADSGATSQFSGAIEIWNVAKNALTTTLLGDPTGSMSSFAFSPDGTTVAAMQTSQVPNNGPGFCELDFWNVASGNLLANPGTAIYSSATDFALTPDGETMAVSGIHVDPTGQSAGNWIGLWNTQSGELNGSLIPNGQTNAVAISPNGNFIADCGFQPIAGGTGPLLEIWSFPKVKLVQSLPTAVTDLTSVAFSSDSSMVIDGGWSNGSQGPYCTLEVWSVSTGRQLATLPTRISGSYISVACSSDGSTLAACGTGSSFLGYQYGVIELWDLKTQSLITSLDTGILYVRTVAFSPDGKTLADGGRRFTGEIGGLADGMELWDISTSNPTLLSTFPALPSYGGVNSLAFSPDGSTLFADAPLGLSAFGLGDYNLLGTFSGSGGILSVTPDGSGLAMLTSAGGLEVATNPFNFSDAVLGITLTPTSVVGGMPSTGTVTLASPAPIDGFSIKLTSNSGAAQVPERIMFSLGATNSTFSITTNGVSSSTSAAIIAGSGNTSQTATLGITPASLAVLDISQLSAAGGSPLQGLAVLNGLAPSGGIVVMLKSSDPNATVPSSVVIQAGQNSASFPVKTKSVTKDTSVTLSATSGGITETTHFVLTSNTIQSLAISPNAVAGGLTGTGYITIAGTAPAGGLKVKLTSSSAAASVPSVVTVPAGKSAASFAVKTEPISTAVQASVTATCNGTSLSTTVLVEPPLPISLTLNPASVKGGKSSVGTVTIGSPAPRGGAVFTLVSSLSSATTPTKLTIPAGATSAKFSIRTAPVTSSTSATITASYGGVPLTAVLAITK